MPPNYPAPFEANIPYKATGYLVRMTANPGPGSHVFGLADGEVGDEVDLLAYGEKRGEFPPPNPISFSCLGKGC